MKNICFILLFCLSLMVQSQDFAPLGAEMGWDLFIPGRTSYYMQPSGNTYLVETFTVDSTRKEGGKEFLYFNAGRHDNHECSWEFRYLYNDFLYMKNPQKMDSLIIVADTVLFIDKYGNNAQKDTFIFKPFSYPGGSWTTNGVTITCIDASAMELFGEPDSVKTFAYKLPDSVTSFFILSKAHGLVKFPPFCVFLGYFNNNQSHPDFELAGFSDGITSAGYVHPDFNEYFTLQEGDIMFWKHINEPDDIMIPPTTEYYVDTITYAHHSPDTVIYDYTRTIYKSDEEETGSFLLSVMYTREVEGLMLSNPTSWPGFFIRGGHETEWFLSGPVFLEIIDEDTISYFSSTFEGLTKISSRCEWYRTPDLFSSVTFSSREGLVSREMMNWGLFKSTLIGSIIQGEKRGITEITTGLNNTLSPDFLIFPNPARDVLIIETGTDHMNYYELIDIAGRLRKSGKFTGSTQLDISDIPEGYYFITVKNEVNHERNIRKLIIRRYPT